MKLSLTLVDARQRKVAVSAIVKVRSMRFSDFMPEISAILKQIDPRIELEGQIAVSLGRFS